MTEGGFFRADMVVYFWQPLCFITALPSPNSFGRIGRICVNDLIVLLGCVSLWWLFIFNKDELIFVIHELFVVEMFPILLCNNGCGFHTFQFCLCV